MEQKKKESTTFSKSIMSVVVLLYFLGAILGAGLLIVAAQNDIKLGLSIDSSMFVAYAGYLGAPTATAIGFYAWKSKAENVIKISKSLEQSNPEIVTAVNSITQIGF